MHETLQNVLYSALIAIIPVLTRYIVVYINTKIEESKTSRYMELIADAITQAVAFTSEAYVDVLKEKGQWSPEHHSEARDLALATAKQQLAKGALVFIEEVYKDVDKWLMDRIWAEVKLQKTQ